MDPFLQRGEFPCLVQRAEHSPKWIRLDVLEKEETDILKKMQVPNEKAGDEFFPFQEEETVKGPRLDREPLLFCGIRSRYDIQV